MTRSLLVLGAGLALLVGVLALLPRAIDWNAFRPAIAGTVERLSGLEIEQVGDLQARILPTPELQLDDVVLADGDVRLRAAALRLGFSPGALLLGNPALTRATLVAPQVELAASLGPEGGAAAGRAALRLIGAASGLRRLQVEDGELRLPGLLRRPLPLRFEARTERAGGPGEFRLTIEDGPELTLAGRFGTFDATAGGRVDLTLESPGAGTVRFEGRLRSDGPGLGGRLMAELGDIRAWAAAMGVDPAVIPAARAAGTARVDLTPDALRVEAIDASLDGTAVTGSLGLTRTAGGRRLEAELAADRLPLTAGEVLRLPPAWLSGTAGLALGELGSAEAAFGQVRLDLAFLGEGRVAIERARGTVPGGGTFAFVGTAEPDEAGRPRLQGALELVGDDIGALAAALGVEPWLPSGAPARGVDLAAEVGWTPDGLTFGDANLQVAGARATGRVALRGGQRPEIDVTLQVARLDLDDPFWRSVAAATRAGSGDVEARLDLSVDTLELVGLTGREARLRGRLVGGALDLDEIRVAALGPLAGHGQGRIQVDPLGFDLTFAGEIADTARLLRHFALPAPPVVQRLGGPVAVRGRLEGSLDAPRLVLEASAGDLVLHAEGDLTDDGSGPRGGAAFSLRHPALAGLLERLGTAGILAADLAGPVEAAGHVGYARGATQVVLDARLGPSTLAVDLGLDTSGARPRATLRAQTDRLPQDLSRAVAGLLREQTGAPPRTATRPGAWSDAPLDLGALQRFDGRLEVSVGETALADEPIADLTLVATVSRGALALDRLQADTLDGRVRAYGRLAVQDGSPSLGLELELEDVNTRTLFGLSPLGIRPEGRLDLEAEVGARGASVRELVGSLAGDAALRLRDGALPGPDLSALERALGAPDATRAGRIADALRGGWTALDEMAGPLRIEAGTVRADDLTLDLAGGRGTLTGSVDLAAWTLDILLGLRLNAAPALPPIELHVAGAIDDPEVVAATSAALAVLERIAPAALEAAP